MNSQVLTLHPHLIRMTKVVLNGMMILIVMITMTMAMMTMMTMMMVMTMMGSTVGLGKQGGRFNNIVDNL